MSQGFTSPKTVLSGNGTQVFVNGQKQSTASGIQINFNIPSGIKNFKVMLSSVSLSAVGRPYLRLGDTTGVYTTGYRTVAGYLSDGAGGAAAISNSSVSSTTWHTSPNLNATQEVIGVYDVTLMDEATNTWVGTWVGADYNATYQLWGSSQLTMTNELTTVQLNASAGAFDGGSVNIIYDNPKPTLAGSGDGIVVQQVHSSDGEVASSTTTLPLNDDTVPQNTEGFEVMTASVTPTNTSNLLKIEVVAQMSHSGTTSIMGGALFQDSTANALASGYAGRNASATSPGVFVLTYWMTAGTTSSTAFKVRIGSSAAGTTTFNGASGSRQCGGTLASSITITEYEV